MKKKLQSVKYYHSGLNLITGSTEGQEKSLHFLFISYLSKIFHADASLKILRTTYNQTLNVPKVSIFNDTLNAFCYTTYLKYHENWQSCPILNIQYFIQGIYILNICAINFKQMYYKYIENLYFFHMGRNDPSYSHFIVHYRQLYEADCIHFIFLLQIWRFFCRSLTYSQQNN